MKGGRVCLLSNFEIGNYGVKHWREENEIGGRQLHKGIDVLKRIRTEERGSQTKEKQTNKQTNEQTNKQPKQAAYRNPSREEEEERNIGKRKKRDDIGHSYSIKRKVNSIRGRPA